MRFDKLTIKAQELLQAAQSDAGTSQNDSFGEYEAEDRAGRGAQGHPDSDLVRPLGDGVGDDPVEAQCRQRGADEGKGADQFCR